MIILDEVILLVFWRNHLKILIVFLNHSQYMRIENSIFFLVLFILFAGDSSFKRVSVTVVGFLVHSCTWENATEYT